LRVKGAGNPVQALPGVVGDESGGLVQVAGAVAVGLDLLRLAGGGFGVSSSPDHLARARAADSDRRRTRVLKILDKLAADGEEITVSSVARAASVHRSLIHRHGDLHAAVLARASEPTPGTATGPQVSRQSLLADVANRRPATVVCPRTSPGLNGALGQAAWEASGLGAPADVETLTRRTTELEQQILDLRGELAERDEDHLVASVLWIARPKCCRCSGSSAGAPSVR
jgi:hypothetical protein